MIEISNNVVCATSKCSDQLAHTRSLIRAFASRLNILIKLLLEHKLKRGLHKLHGVHSCQNTTLLQTTCDGSFFKIINYYSSEAIIT